MKRSGRLLLLAAAVIFCLSACGHIRSKSALVSYAEKTFGECSFLREENDEPQQRAVYLTDRDTNIEYKVVSQMRSIYIDGARFGASEYMWSDFEQKYRDYVIDLAEAELTQLNTGHPADIIWETDLTPEIRFEDRTSSADCVSVCRIVCAILKSHDVKDLLSWDFLVYCETPKINVGYYESDTDTYTEYRSYKVIDYVYSMFPDAEYLYDLAGYPDQYLTYEDMERMGIDLTNGLNAATIYYFRTSDGREIAALDMHQWGCEDIPCFDEKSGEKILPR